MYTLSIIIPVYQNEESLLELEAELMQIEAQLSLANVSLEIIFVDDGSDDGSLRILRDVQSRRPSTVVLRHFSNHGSMPAILTGLKRASGDCITFLAADLQDPPALIPEMVLEWLRGHKFVIRTRNSRRDPLPSRIFAWINYRLVRFLVMSNYPPRGFDMMILDKAFLPHLLKCGHNKNLSIYTWSMGVPAKILYYDRLPRAHGKSMWTFKKKIRFFIDSTIGFTARPMRIATAIGFTIASFCFAYAAIVFIGKLVGAVEVPGFAALAVLLGFLNGCLFMFMGLLGEYIWRIYREMDRHPEPMFEDVVVSDLRTK